MNTNLQDWSELILCLITYECKILKFGAIVSMVNLCFE